MQDIESQGKVGDFLGVSVHIMMCGQRLFSKSFSHGASEKNHLVSGYNVCLMFDLLAIFSFIYNKMYIQLNVKNFINQVFG